MIENTQQIVIGISGKIGSGKNAVADLIQKHSNIEFEQTAFAKKLKQVVALLCEIDYEDTLSQEAKNTFIPEYNSTIGNMYQVIGTSVMRDNYDKNVWVKALHLELKNNYGTNYLITDVRFKNEAESLLNINAGLIRVVRPNNKTAELSNRDLNHTSETDLDNFTEFNYIIMNDGSLKDLEIKVIDLLQSLGMYKKPSLLVRLFKKLFKR